MVPLKCPGSVACAQQLTRYNTTQDYNTKTPSTMFDDLQETAFDVAIIGTGLIESVMAACVLFFYV